MPENPLVTVIVLNWNGKELLKDCLESLKKVDYPNYNVLVVDNGSNDGSVSYVQTEFPDVELLILDQNYGYAVGNNRGFEYANSNGAEYVIFLNNDTIVQADFMAPLLEPFNEQAIGQTVPKIFYANNKEKIWYAGGKINFWSGNIYHEGIREFDSEKYSKNKQTDYATGCCFCMRSKDFADLNGFDELFPMYAEDVDLSLRVRKKGKKITMASSAKVWHEVSASVGGEFSFYKIKRKFGGLLRIYIKHASMIEWLSIIILSPVLILASLLRLLMLKFHQSSSL